ncbi:MAG TPA: signal peptidase II [Candidatus Dojkabacteria bacterium]|nr:signal peptidase II [Candidatus Dojkabacteria bacterium]
MNKIYIYTNKEKVFLLLLIPFTHNLIVYVLNVFFLQDLIINKSIYLIETSNVVGILFSFIALFFILLLLFNIKENRIFQILLLLFGSILTNLIDRLLYGGVMDYISIKWLGVFNIADIGIIVSIGILFVLMVINKKLN